MRKKVPYHSPRHKNIALHDFVTKPWTMHRSERDLMIMEEEDNDYDNNNGNHQEQQQHQR